MLTALEMGAVLYASGAWPQAVALCQNAVLLAFLGLKELVHTLEPSPKNHAE